MSAMRDMRIEVRGGPYDGQELVLDAEFDVMDPPAWVRWTGPLGEEGVRRLRAGEQPPRGSLYVRRANPDDDGVLWLYDYVEE